MVCDSDIMTCLPQSMRQISPNESQTSGHKYLHSRIIHYQLSIINSRTNPFSASNFLYTSRMQSLKAALRPLYDAWMTFAHVLGWINGRIILTALYVVVIGPYAVVRRIGLVFTRRSAPSTYWRLREAEKHTLETFRRIF